MGVNTKIHIRPTSTTTALSFSLVKKREANSICRVDNGDNGENEVIFYPNLHIALLTNSMEIDLNKYRNLYFGINL